MELLAHGKAVSCLITLLPTKLLYNLGPLCCFQQLLDVLEMVKPGHPQQRWQETASSALLPALIVGQDHALCHRKFTNRLLLGKDNLVL